MNNRAGIYKNNLSGDMAYKSFMPAVLPPNPPIEPDKDIVELLVKANKQLALLEGISSRIPNIHLFISMYVRKEALMSSQIEGTQATLEDVLDPRLEENTNRPVGDVVNYIKATDYAINRLKKLPLCNRLIKEAHEILLSGVRGQNKSPGEFRHSQNWIGAVGCNLQNARYIPPSVEDMIQAMSDLEKYINKDDSPDVLIRAALIHYQFETIHPFLDGNGRIGRLLIPLFLMEKKVLSTPALYISYFLKKNRIEYYDRMNEVRLKGNYEQWIKFFLEVVIETSKIAKEKFRNVVELTMEMDRVIMDLPVKPENAKKVLDVLYDEPIVSRKKILELIDIKQTTLNVCINALKEKNIIIETTGYSRNQVFAFQKYIDLFLK